MTAFDYLSDIHVDLNLRELDYFDWEKHQKSDTLVIGGDSGNGPEFMIGVVMEARRFYSTVMFTDGNHEHYNGTRRKKSTVGSNMALLQEMADYTPGVEYLNGSSYQMEDVLFVGANGWYDFTAYPFSSREAQHMSWKTSSNDSRYIRFDRGGYPDKLAELHATKLEQLVFAAQGDSEVSKIVCVTHTIPNERGSIGNQHPWAFLNGSYINPQMQRVLDADTNGKIGVWTFGHTHFITEFQINGVRFVNNARGYHGERRPHDFEGVVQIIP